MAGSDLELMPNERLVVSENPHWWFFWKQVAEALGVLVLAFLALSFDGTIGTIFFWLTVLAAVAWVLHTIYQFLHWRTRTFAVTSRRVIYQTGLAHREGVSIPLDRVNNVNFQQSLIERMLGNGSLMIESAGETGTSIFENIPDPDGVRSTIFHEMEASKQDDAQRNAAAVAQAMDPSGLAGGRASVSDRLQELDGLRDKGLISPEEHASRRAAILDDL